MKCSLKAILLLLITIFAAVSEARRHHSHDPTTDKSQHNNCKTKCGGADKVTSFQSFDRKADYICTCRSKVVWVAKRGDAYSKMEPEKAEFLKQIQDELRHIALRLR
jgi:hypothetical protein